MEFELHEINVTLSNEQKQKIRNAFINREKIRLRLTKDALLGSDTLLVPTRFFEEMDNEDGIDAVVDEQTEEEMQEELQNHKYRMQEQLKNYIDQTQEQLKNHRDEMEAQINREMPKVLKFYRDEIEAKSNQEFWEYYELFFHPATDESMENKGIEFNLDYSLVNDLAKDFVKDNIKKLFE